MRGFHLFAVLAIAYFGYRAYEAASRRDWISAALAGALVLAGVAGWIHSTLVNRRRMNREGSVHRIDLRRDTREPY